MKKSNIILFSDCFPVKGFSRSIICDTRNNKYHIIPNGLYNILENYNGKTLESIKENFNHEFDDIIDEYIDFLSCNKLLFFNSNPNLFPKISTEWSSPSLITNIIIDYDEIIHDFEHLTYQFEILKSSTIQLRFFKKTSINYIQKIADILNKNKSRIVSVYFILPYNESNTIDSLKLLISENTRIQSIILYNSPEDKIYENINNKMGYVMQVKRSILNEKYCGIINEDYFFSNIKLFSESQHHNTCLNRKISIDRFGNIKNCPSLLESYGNIKDVTLQDALKHPDFKRYWYITKDQIEVCKDCEFRHICTDCRAYIEEPQNIHSKPLKCGYNPYTNEWSEWSTNPLKHNAIEHYGMQDLVKKDA